MLSPENYVFTTIDFYPLMCIISFYYESVLIRGKKVVPLRVKLFLIGVTVLLFQSEYFIFTKEVAINS